MFFFLTFCPSGFHSFSLSHPLFQNMNNDYEYREDNPICYFHPRERIVGICALCLKERLHVLALKQGNHPLPKDVTRAHHSRMPTLTIPKIFALGSFLHRRSKSASVDFDDASTSSQEDSFISIKFENNGIASWDKGSTTTNPKISNNEDLKNEGETKSVVEHHQGKSHGVMRWRKRIGQIFHLMRWKRRSSKANVCHVGTKVGGVKLRKGWIRPLTKRRTME